jgi:hypothetical protein
MLSEVLAYSAVVLILGWLGLSTVFQLPLPAMRSLRRFDLAGLIPNWSFFAPRPGTFDFHLLYRDSLVDGSVADWTEVALVGERHWWHTFWNPGRRGKKALFDMTVHLLQEAGAGEGNVEPNRSIQLGMPYLALLTYISGLPRLSASVGTQFLVVISHGYDAEAKPEPLFASDVHGI